MTKPNDLAELAILHCKELAKGKGALPAKEAGRLLKLLKGWKQVEQTLVKTYEFADFYETMGFVNAIAWIANQQNHHPDLAVGYDRCVVSFSTHSAGALTLNDFICAARVETFCGSGK